MESVGGVDERGPGGPAASTEGVAGDEGGDGRVDVDEIVLAAPGDFADAGGGGQEVARVEGLARPVHIPDVVEGGPAIGAALDAAGGCSDTEPALAEVAGEGEEEAAQSFGNGRYQEDSHEC